MDELDEKKRKIDDPLISTCSSSSCSSHSSLSSKMKKTKRFFSVEKEKERREGGEEDEEEALFEQYISDHSRRDKKFISCEDNKAYYEDNKDGVSNHTMLSSGEPVRSSGTVFTWKKVYLEVNDRKETEHDCEDCYEIVEMMRNRGKKFSGRHVFDLHMICASCFLLADLRLEGTNLYMCNVCSKNIDATLPSLKIKEVKETKKQTMINLFFKNNT